MEFCSSKHPTYAKDMKVPGLLPDGGVPLPPSDDDMPPLDPKHKAVIIYLFHFAQEATSGNTNHDETEALVTLWQFAASVFMKKVYKLNIHPDSIVKYCSRVSANAGKAGLRWDHLAAAEIISSQVRDENTFNEVTSFLTKLVDSLNSTEQFFRKQIWKATGLNERGSLIYHQLEGYWHGATRSRCHCPSMIADPDLKQSREIDLKTANDYQYLLKFEKTLAKRKAAANKKASAKRKPANPDD